MRLSLLIAGLFLLGWTAASLAHPCGTQFLRENGQRFPLPRAKPLATRQEKAPIGVGTRLEFLVAGNVFLVPATCRYLGEHVYIFIEDTQWDTNGGPVAQPDVDRLADLFERATPADSSRGLFALETATFGPVPDVDGDPRIFLLVLDIAEPNIVGFFDRRVATYEIPELRRDTIYLDAYAVRRQIYLADGTLAHEFQHLIHWGQDPDEETWVDEGLSGYAEELAGYPEADSAAVPAFLERPDIDLTQWQQEAYNYGATYLFTSYLAERYGRDLIRRLVAEPRNGVFGVEAALAESGVAQKFADVWAGWAVANAVSDGDYTYAALRGRRARNYPYGELPLEQAEGVVSGQWGTLNVLLRRSGSLAIDFAGEGNSRFRAWVYAWKDQGGALQEVELEPDNQGQAEVLGADSVLVIAGRTSLADGRFLLSARGIIPTAVAEPAGGVLPARLSLGPGYPNPFNSQVLISFALPAAAEVELDVYSAVGQRLRVLRQGWYEAGLHLAGWDGRDAAGREVGSGIYLVVLQSGAAQLGRQLTLLR